MSMVNYIRQHVGFMEYAADEGLTAAERMLWYALMHLFNQRARGGDWPDAFIPISNKRLLTLFPMGYDTMCRARKGLADRGLIEFQPGVRNRSNPVYRMNYRFLEATYVHSAPRFSPLTEDWGEGGDEDVTVEPAFPAYAMDEEAGIEGTGSEGTGGEGTGGEGTGNREQGTGMARVSNGEPSIPAFAGSEGTRGEGTGNRERGTGMARVSNGESSIPVFAGSEGTGGEGTGNREQGTGMARVSNGEPSIPAFAGSEGTGGEGTGNREQGTGMARVSNGEPSIPSSAQVEGNHSPVSPRRGADAAPARTLASTPARAPTAGTPFPPSPALKGIHSTAPTSDPTPPKSYPQVPIPKPSLERSPVDNIGSNPQGSPKNTDNLHGNLRGNLRGNIRPNLRGNMPHNYINNNYNPNDRTDTQTIRGFPLEEDEAEEERIRILRETDRLKRRWREAFGRDPTPALLETLHDWGVRTFHFPMEILFEAIAMAARRNADCPSRYVIHLLKDWNRRHIRTLPQLDDYLEGVPDG